MYISSQMLEADARKEAERKANGVRRFVNLAAQKKKNGERREAAAKVP